MYSDRYRKILNKTLYKMLKKYYEDPENIKEFTDEEFLIFSIFEPTFSRMLRNHAKGVSKSTLIKFYISQISRHIESMYNLMLG